MTLEDFKNEIEAKFESQIRELNQQIGNRNYTIEQLEKKILLLKKEGKSLWQNAAKFKSLITELIDDNGFMLPSIDYDSARIFEVENDTRR